ncbi:RBP11-like subunits of RNA polymerase, partial [Ramicandelaber brevisporus]
TFVLHKETHTLGNVLRSMTIRNPDVDFCAYAQPHPTDDFIKIRVQTNGSSTATAVLREACKNVKGMAKHAQDVLAKALENKEY